MRTRNSFLWIAAKSAAVALALGVLAWFVVAEQRRANPAPPPAVPRVQASDASAPASAAPADPAVFLPSSKVLAVDAQPSLDEAVFLMGSKSGIATPLASGAEAQAAPPEPVFLPNSKSRVLGGLVRPNLAPAAPAQPDPHVP